MQLGDTYVWASGGRLSRATPDGSTLSHSPHTKPVGFAPFENLYTHTCHTYANTPFDSLQEHALAPGIGHLAFGNVFKGG